MSISNPSNDGDAIVAAAHEARKRGWRVIQIHSVGPDGKTCSCKRGANCKSAGKHPINAEWQNTARMSAADIQEAWSGIRAKANIGVATGEPSGIWVLDVDPKDGGVAELKKLIAEHGSLPRTYVVRTGSGGFHYYFTQPHSLDIRNSASKIAPGIDVRGTGGQVVAPPSVSDVGAYKALDPDAPVLEAPEWLVDMVRYQEPEASPVTSDDVPDRSDLEEAERQRLDTYAAKAIRGNVDRLRQLSIAGWDGEPWDATTFEVACSLIEIANSPWNVYTEAQAYHDLFSSAPRDDGFTDDTVNTKWESARGKVGNKARSVPEGPRDDFMFGEDVRSAAPAPQSFDNPPATETIDETERVNPEQFFGDKGGLNTTILASAVLADGDIAWGADQAFWEYEGGVWRSAKDVVRARCTRLLRYKYRPSHASTVEDYLRFNIPQIACLPVEEYVNFQNGMLDWRTGELVPHSPDHLSTVQIGSSYDAAAECPKFEAWLAEVLDDDYIQVAWEMLGYLLYNGNPLQLAFLLYGSGGNGKGTLMRVMADMLGRDAYASESLDMLNGNNFSAINLFGKTANLAGDIDGTYQESTANFKKLTGEDVYAGERKYGDRFTFVSWAVPVFSANKIPGSADVTEGYLRRWVMIHFAKTFEKRIRGVSDTFTPELPGITAKAIVALRRLMERGEFELHGKAAAGREEFAMAIDQVRQWAKYATISAPNHHEPREAVYDAYRVWAERTGSGKLRASEFYHRLEAIGFPTVNHAGVPSIRGLLASTHDAAPDPALASPSANFF